MSTLPSQGEIYHVPKCPGLHGHAAKKHYDPSLGSWVIFARGVVAGVREARRTDKTKTRVRKSLKRG